MSRWIIFAAALSTTGCFNGLLVTPTTVGGPLEETVINEPLHWYCRDKVAIIDVDGIIMNVRSSGILSDGENPVSIFREKLDAAADDKRVKAVVLRINSPGGAVTASDMMYQDLLNFRKDTGKPVVACMMDTAASGAYYLAMACDRVYAHPTTVTGSIGVIMTSLNLEGLLAKVGVRNQTFKAGEHKDILSPLRGATAEERRIIQSILDDLHARFVSVVREGRPKLDVSRLAELTDGRIFDARQALAAGLIDQIGDLHAALDAAKAAAGVDEARVVAYRRPAETRENIYSAARGAPAQVNVLPVDLGALATSGPRFMYLWAPGLGE